MFSFGQPARTTTAASTAATGGLGAQVPAFGNVSFGTPTAGSALSGFALPQTTAANLAQKTVRFDVPATACAVPTSASTLSSLLAPATSSATLGTSSLISGFQLGTSTAARPTGTLLPLTSSVASAPAIGFSFGTNASVPTTTTGGLLGLTTTAGSLAPTSTCAAPTILGLGGIAGNIGTTAVGKTCDAKAVKENCVPPDILTAVDEFTKHVKKQKSVRESSARMSSKPLFRIQDDNCNLRQQLSVITSGLQHIAVAIEKLKKETAQELKHAEIAQRTKDTPPGLQYENTAPSEYFIRLANEFEVFMQLYRQQIMETEKHIASADQSSALSPQDLSLLFNKLNDGFIALSAQLQVAHEAVKEQKAAYLHYRRTFHGDTTNMFDRKTVGRSVSQTIPFIPTTLGPTPFSSMSTTAGAAMASALNRTQPIAGAGGGFGLSAGSSTGVCGLSQSSALPSATGTLLGQSAIGNFGSTTGGLFGNTSAVAPSFGTTSPLAAGFALQKTPIGSKRGKNA